MSQPVSQPAAAEAELHIRPVSGAVGAEVRGLDLSEITDAQFEQVHALMLKYLVLTAVHVLKAPQIGELSAEHPVVRVHPVTGRRSLYVTRMWTSHIPQLSRQESDAVLQHLFDHSEQPRFTCRHRFPEARFVHLYREGPDCALSMSRHPGFQLIEFLADLSRETGTEAAAELERLLSDDSFDLLSALNRPMPVERYGALWSRMITSGLAHLDAVPAGLRMSLAFEDLLDTPEYELTRLAAHIGVEPDPAWVAAARRSLDGGRRGASGRLPTDSRAAQRASCAPGAHALATMSAEERGAVSGS
ncbi:TauD/TfdA family dioxygenase [Streptomyces sp. 21So2-11]|uniref:TauD/TfdA dioxygenase family protein n=1 Tax=Streptomyces sp. 21So2-11 TaxID=3144408 RepID=UPI003219F3BA